MISFNKFINAIHDAIMGANETLFSHHEKLFNQFFIKEQNDSADSEEDSANSIFKAKSVVMECPTLGSAGKITMNEVHVPLITLVPLSTIKIDKVKVKMEFQMAIVDDELQLLFPKEKPPRKHSVWKFGQRSPTSSTAMLEIVFDSTDTTDGLKYLIDAYERALKAQIPQ